MSGPTLERFIQPHWSVDRRAWNGAWETFLKAMFAPRMKYRDMLAGSPQSREGLERVSVHSHIQAMHNHRQSLTEMQEALTEYMVYHPNFEGEWVATPQTAREELILEGLVRTCEAAPDMEPRRMYAPEASLDFLGQRGGRAFLDLLAQMENPSSPEPRIVSHEGYDAMMGVGDVVKRSPEEKVIARGQTLTRNVFLCLVVYNTILAFYGQKKEYRTTRVTNDAKVIRGLKMRGPDYQYEQQKAAWDAARWCCKACGTLEAALSPGKRLLICAKCKTVDRVVKYCSRGCQKRDWPDHKLICGKLLEADQALKLFGGLTTGAERGVQGAASMAGDDAGELGPGAGSSAFPLPLPPFVHSRHLKYQIQLLRNHPEFDYIYLHSEDGQIFSGLSLEGPGKVTFLSVREQAFRSGEIEVVLALYACLAYHGDGDVALRERLQKQLSLEYGVDKEVLQRCTVIYERDTPN